MAVPRQRDWNRIYVFHSCRSDLVAMAVPRQRDWNLSSIFTPDSTPLQVAMAVPRQRDWNALTLLAFSTGVFPGCNGCPSIEGLKPPNSSKISAAVLTLQWLSLDRGIETEIKRFQGLLLHVLQWLSLDRGIETFNSPVGKYNYILLQWLSLDRGIETIVNSSPLYARLGCNGCPSTEGLKLRLLV